ncbi:FAD-dependent oxidoreductase [Aspergillus homomorphus CBS 101889]|uniref:FAD/NAD(P)-binding domain-containing protein n=1 Tax=Aspergillus homomorphus (strain CBS 101889) TaxID=1450537 RepID=A0A395HN12_ASPHC|nr:FAD/NAD(P)-binding domain-containing protein [Aspergillus homomorphus CBS 101889]RAL09227.1 FAD/NAD(P)-binding domain-containing protein [Aspergillus homomorphus CBS 101889]
MPPTNSPNNLKTTPLNIAIIGSGISGLLAARILRPQHNVTIYERHSHAVETGAAINIGPNGIVILDSVGFDRRRARTLTYNKAGAITTDTVIDYEREFGADWLFFHRSDLHNEPLRLATAPSAELGVEGVPTKVRFGAKAVGVDVEAGEVRLARGDVVRADLVVVNRQRAAADGIKSTLRESVLPCTPNSTPIPAGSSVFRFTLTRAQVHAALGHIPDKLDRTQPGCITTVLPSTPRSAGAAHSPRVWNVHRTPPLPSYINGRTVLIGDAAHAMPPHQGQGGTQAIEDAEPLRVCFGDHVTSGAVPALLRDFDRVRRPRASKIQVNNVQAKGRRSAAEIHRFLRFNWTFAGIWEEVRNLEMSQAGAVGGAAAGVEAAQRGVYRLWLIQVGW